jgi:hypothetical protein
MIWFYDLSLARYGWAGVEGGTVNECHVPLTTSLTLVRSATMSSTYSGGRRASIVRLLVD